MRKTVEQNQLLLMLTVGLSAWLIPGGGHFLLKEKKRATVIFATIFLTFSVGLYIGSIGVIDPVGAWPWYLAQIMNSPLVAILGHIAGGGAYPVYGRPSDLGRIYTCISGLLNLLCAANALYLAYIGRLQTSTSKGKF